MTLVVPVHNVLEIDSSEVWSCHIGKRQRWGWYRQTGIADGLLLWDAAVPCVGIWLQFVFFFFFFSFSPRKSHKEKKNSLLQAYSATFLEGPYLQKSSWPIKWANLYILYREVKSSMSCGPLFDIISEKICTVWKWMSYLLHLKPSNVKASWHNSTIGINMYLFIPTCDFFPK